MTVKQGFGFISVALRWCSSLMILLLLTASCTTPVERQSIADDVPGCHIIYDAGSTRTRLYIYEQSATGWIKHRGPRTAALADPARGIRGKTMSDAGSVVDDIVAAIDRIRSDGPLDKKGIPRWPAFDWQKECRLDAVNVNATAGMRLAEQQNPHASEKLWEMLNKRLSAAVGMPVTTRTLNGFEEGLFAWLATREGQDDGNFGVAEMGGASMQVTFVCPACETARQIRVKGQIVPVYSHSFLGWGQDEAWKKIGYLPACARGAGLNDPDWKPADCAVGMTGFSHAAADVSSYVSSADGLRWYLSDAFRYMKDTDIDQFCRLGTDSGFEAVSSCFRAVYLQEVLDQLGIPVDAETTDVDWTLGAVVCTITHCLENQ
ncbi:MAG: hypothetical protein WBN06_06330 [Lysobacterales bacterium]